MIKRIPVLSKYINNGELRRQFMKYLVTGLTSFIIEYCLFIGLLDIMGVNYMVSNVIVYSLVFWFNYFVNRVWTFESKLDIRKQLLMYASLFAINLTVANVFILYLLTDVGGIHPKISKVLVMGAIVLWNFILYKKVIYRK